MSFKLKDIVSEEHFKILSKLREIFSYRSERLSGFGFTFDGRVQVKFKTTLLSDSDLRQLLDSFESIWVEAPFILGANLTVKVSGLKPKQTTA